MTPLPPPTPDLQPLVDAIGIDAAFALIEARGGNRVYVPMTALPWLIDTVGEAAARRLVEIYGRGYLKVPLGRTWRALAYQARGMSYAQIARRCGCTEDAVWRILDRRQATSKQYDLFNNAAE